ncbi:MAG: LamG domain-containing protein [Candidatus Eisenbacteria bacterium]
MRPTLHLFALLLAGFALCAATDSTAGAKKPRPPKRPATAPLADSVTVALWRFDETLGSTVADSGPFRLNGIAGPDTRPDFGRWKNARVFTNTLQSFTVVPTNPVMDLTTRFTIEAWVYVNAVSKYELQTIAARWSPLSNEQSWVLGVAGLDRRYPAVPKDSPGWFRDLVSPARPMHLVFAFRSPQSAGTQSFVSVNELPIGRWVHVAATLDGEVVTLWLDGRLDSQVVSPIGMRAVEAPITIGSTLDPHRLTDFGGDLRVDPVALPVLYYQFDGLLDEVRLSSAARTSFESAGRR